MPADPIVPQTTAKRVWPWELAAVALIVLGASLISGGFKSRYPGTGYLLLLEAIFAGGGVWCWCMANKREASANG